MMPYYLYAIVNVVTFIIWGVDKQRARDHAWRVPEATLVTLIMLGGAPGALAGMLIFRHKTRKLAFWFAVLFGFALHGYLLFFA